MSSQNTSVTLYMDAFTDANVTRQFTAYVTTVNIDNANINQQVVTTKYINKVEVLT